MRVSRILITQKKFRIMEKVKEFNTEELQVLTFEEVKSQIDYLEGLKSSLVTELNKLIRLYEVELYKFL